MPIADSSLCPDSQSCRPELRGRHRRYRRRAIACSVLRIAPARCTFSSALLIPQSLPTLLLLLLPAVLLRADDEYADARAQMVQRHLVERGIKDERVLKVMSQVLRHEFVPDDQRPYAYDDISLAIGHGQTISPPYIVALMTEKLQPRPEHRVLEIGTGSGYQAAVLSKLAKEVYTIEIVEPLAKSAEERLARLGCANVKVKAGDGYKGWPEHAPFDSIVVTCAPDHVPEPLIEQLREGGRMVIPVGEKYIQTLYVMEKKDGKLTKAAVTPVYFVPMTGEAQKAAR